MTNEQGNKRVLITGISGFVGSLLAKSLLNQGLEVYGLLRRRADRIAPHNLKMLGIEDKIHLIEGDLKIISSIDTALSVSDADIVFHLGGQSFVPSSFENPLETMSSNCCGTANLLEAIRIKDIDPVIVFAGSSEEYGLVISSNAQYEKTVARYGTVVPEPQKIPEVPISETNPLRPMSPYAVSKLYGDYLMRNYRHSYGVKTVISRAFNHEGAGRGSSYVTSIITSQITNLKLDGLDSITIGNVNAFRDWSHVEDVIAGYQLLAEKGRYGDIYNQGSMRTNSVMSYLLLSLDEAGYHVSRIKTFKGDKVVDDPIEIDSSELFGVSFEKTRIDDMMLRGELEFSRKDGGVTAYAGSKKIKIAFDPERLRPAEVPITLSDTEKIKSLGFRVKYTLRDIIRDQLNYYQTERDRSG
jgi:GDPmannose 4,6-dehydratase